MRALRRAGRGEVFGLGTFPLGRRRRRLRVGAAGVVVAAVAAHGGYGRRRLCSGLLLVVAAPPADREAAPEPAREVGQQQHGAPPQPGGRSLEERPHWRRRRRRGDAETARVAAEARGAARVAVQREEILQPQRLTGLHTGHSHCCVVTNATRYSSSDGNLTLSRVRSEKQRSTELAGVVCLATV